MEPNQTSVPQKSIHILLPHTHFLKWVVMTISLVLFGFGLGVLVMIAAGKKDNNTAKTITILASGSTEVAANEVTIGASEYKDFASEAEAKVFVTPIIEKVKAILNSLKISESAYTLTSSVDGGIKYGSLVPSQDSLSKTSSLIVEPSGSPVNVTQPYYPSRNSYYANIYFTVYLKKDQFSLVDRIAQGVNASGFTKPSYTNYTAIITSEDKNKARSSALLDANKQVEELKKLNNLRIGEVQSIRDLSVPEKSISNGKMYPPAPPLYQNPGADKLYIEPGRKSAALTSSYEVVYALK